MFLIALPSREQPKVKYADIESIIINVLKNLSQQVADFDSYTQRVQLKKYARQTILFTFYLPLFTYCVYLICVDIINEGWRI